MTLVWGWDATHSNLGGVPAGQGAGYTTGTPDIKWTPEDWASHPGAVRIDQDAADSDPSADVLDVETGAATPASVPGWVARAWDDFHSGARPGQRWPVVYCSLDRVAAVQSELAATTPEHNWPQLWVADWSWTMDQAAAQIGKELGGMFVVGVQFANRGAFDSDVFDAAWLAAVSGPVTPVEPPSSPTLTERLTTMPELAQGATGGAVRTLQGLLVARGYFLGTTGGAHDGIDGDFGALTHAAVVSFQGENHIATDGIVGPITWPLLPIS